MAAHPGLLRAGAASPEDEAARAELRRQLADAVDALPVLYRATFMLRAVEGLDVAATAAALQVRPDVVKTRYLRARAMLRERLGGDAEALAPGLHAFDGRRCDELVAGVLARLRAAGLVRDH